MQKPPLYSELPPQVIALLEARAELNWLRRFLSTCNKHGWKFLRPALFSALNRTRASHKRALRAAHALLTPRLVRKQGDI